MLPIIPDPFKLVVRQIKTEDGYKADPTALKQLEVIRKLLGQADQVISCTDAGREGELIMRYVLEYLGYHKETKRLWISSMTEKSIREGFDSLKSSKEFDNLYRAAKARRESDWVVGMNASLSLSMAAGKSNYSLGRVQTPALGMICRRYLDNRDFIAKPYYLLQLRTTKAGKELVLTCTGKYDTPEKLDVDRKKVYEETTAKVVQVEKKEVPEEAPLLYDLTALQRSANTKLGLTAEQTLNIAQKLYEGGYISYPRTGCSYITEDIFEQVPSLIGLLKQHPRFTWHAENLCNQPLNRHCVDDSKMTDHHALIITENYPQRLSLDEQNIYSMIAGRMLEAFSGKCLKETVSVQADCNGVLFGIKGSQIKVPGWRGIYNEPSEKEEGSLLRSALSFDDLEAGDILTPRIDMEGIPVESTQEEAAEVFANTGYSRLPVYEETLDHIVGILYHKDFYNRVYGTDTSIREVMRPALFTTANQKIDELMQELQKKKLHIAIVLDEFGGTVGLITLEDILEELVGEIWDEHDEEEVFIHKVDKGTYLVDAAMDFDDFADFFHLKTDSEMVSVSGWVMERCGGVPESGDRFTYDDLDVLVVKVDHHRIEELRVTQRPHAGEKVETALIGEMAHE